MTKRTKLELETIICFNEQEKLAIVFTYNQRLIRRLNEDCEKDPSYRRLEDQSGACRYLVPRRKVTVLRSTKGRPQANLKQAVLRTSGKVPGPEHK